MNRFLLDTGMLLGFIRGAEWARRAREEFNLGAQEAIVFTSTVCVGELLALAEKFGWGKNKRSRLEEVLSKFPVLDINNEGTLHAYALIDAWTHGHKVGAPNQTSPPKPATPMGQNDLWVAATVHESQAALLTTDKDFAHLDGVWIRFHYVDQKPSH